MPSPDEDATARLRDHLAQARSAADMITEYAVEGSPEALLADAVQHLADAIAELGAGPGQGSAET